MIKKRYFEYCVKNPLLIISFLLILGINLFISIFFTRMGYTGFRELYLFSRWNFYICTLIAGIFYLTFVLAINAECADAIDSIWKRKFSWQRGISVCLCSFWILVQLLLIGLLLYCSMNNDGTSYFIKFFPRAYLMNIFIPQLIFIGVAYICSCLAMKNKMVSVSILVLFILMTSPLLENLIWREKPSGFAIDQLIKKIRWLFSILYQNSIWTPDTQYGLQTENVRFLLQLFWLLTILVTILWLHRKLLTFRGIILGGAIISFILSNLSSSIYRQDESWDGIFADVNYYIASEMEPHPQVIPAYRFSDYDLEISINNNLKVKGQFILQSDTRQSSFIFTLYHGYEIKRLLVDGKKMEYSRQGDIITLYFEKQIKKATITIDYEGSSGKYYSNSQGIMLPGYFPWYPMAGEKQVFVQYPYYNGGNGYNPYNRITASNFKVKLDTKCPSVTNLDGVENMMYTGETDSLTILGGNILLTENEKFANILPLDISDTNEETYLDNMYKSWDKMMGELLTIYGLDVTQLQSKKVLLCSKDIGRNFANNYLIEFKDYILVTDVYLNSGNYINYLLYGNGKDSKLGDLLSSVVIFYDNLSAEDVINCMIEAEGQQEEALEELGDSVTFSNTSKKLKQMQTKIGSDALLKEIIDYLLNDSVVSDDKFFELLKEKYR